MTKDRKYISSVKSVIYKIIITIYMLKLKLTIGTCNLHGGFGVSRSVPAIYRRVMSFDNRSLQSAGR
jgi:hypothetical protein